MTPMSGEPAVAPGLTSGRVADRALAFLDGPIASRELARFEERRPVIVTPGANAPGGAAHCLEVSVAPALEMSQTQLTQPGCNSTAPGCGNYSGGPDCLEETGEVCNSDEPDCKFDKTDPPQCPGEVSQNCPPAQTADGCPVATQAPACPQETQAPVCPQETEYCATEAGCERGRPRRAMRPDMSGGRPVGFRLL